MSQARYLRRVRRDEAPFVERRTDGLDLCLDCWTTWMGKSDKDLGAHAQKLLRGDSDGYDGNDNSQQRRDDEIAQATDAMIYSLTIVHRWAIYRKCGIATAWRYQHVDYLTVAIDACCELEKKLRGNIATRMLFL